jgi:ribosomal protein S27AE
MKKSLFFLVVSIFFISLVSCNNNKSSDEDEDMNYNPALVARDNLKAYKKAAKLARKQMRDLESQEERTWNYIDTAQTLVDKEEESQKKTELIEKKDTCCPSIIQNFFLNEKKTEKPVTPPKTGKPGKPVQPKTPPAPKKMKEEKKVEKVVENKKDDCPTCGTKSFLLFQYGKAFCVEKSTGDVFQYNGELSAADERQLETSTKLKTGLCIHKTGVREYKICNLDGSSFTGEPWK